ncbi:MAG: flagellar biosynthetic protein FliR [Lachnoclostridium sp.]|jgi:flagellar biosynthetic protein FliR|nr:flagellar biosynthetic protein FliR [Lachnoclostridium sp.]
MTFTIEYFEFILLVLIRLTSYVMAAPFLSYASIPIRVKLVISVVLAVIVVNILEPVQLEYSGIVGLSTLIVKEACVGVALGFVSNICLYILNFAGQLMDMEIGLSMTSLFDPQTRIQGTISGTFYLYSVMLLMLVSHTHYFIIRAIIDSFQLFNIGEAVFSRGLAEVLTDFFPQYFLIAFRILLPIFGCMLMINVVLGVLARAAPQMNMFVVGMQLKVIVGVFILFIIVETMPGVAGFIFDEMQTITRQIMDVFTPSQ